MNFDFSDDQQAIKRTAKDLLADRVKLERVRELADAGEYDETVWKELCELGWPGIFIEEQYGGQGLGVVELVILMEELGYALAPVPFLSNAAAGLLIQAAGSDEQKERWLPGIASGEQRGAGGLLRGDEAKLVPDADGRRRDRALRGRRRAGRRALGGRGRAGDDDGLHAPLRPRARERRRRSARGRARTGRGRGAGGRIGRAGRARAAGDGDGRGVRARPQAVRPADRGVPGRVAPLRPDAARDRGRALRHLLRRLDRGRRAELARAGRVDGQGVCVGRRLARVLVVAPGARRHRLHVGARPPLLPEAGQGRRSVVGQRRASTASASRACPASARKPRLPYREPCAGGRAARFGPSSVCASARPPAATAPRSAPAPPGAPSGPRRPSAGRPRAGPGPT